jgi:hypothetical protein
LAELERSALGIAALETEATIATLVRALEVSRHAALHDPLTRLANRSLEGRAVKAS